MKGKLKGIALPVIFFCVTLFISSAQVQSSQGTAQVTNQITPQVMQIYAQTLISTYVQANNLYFPSIQGNLTFYPSTSYNITFYSSSQGGAALLIEPSTVQAFQEINTSEDIETSVFGGNLSLGGLFEGWVDHLLISDVTLVNWGARPFIHLLNDSNAVVKGISITRTSLTQYYYYVSIKTSNETSHWTPQIASKEAVWILGSDTGQDFVNSQVFAQLLPIPEITSLLEDMKSQLSNSSYLASTQYLADLQKVKTIAEQYGISTDILNELIGFINAQTTGQLPTFPILPTLQSSGTNQKDNWSYAIFSGIYPIIIFGIYSIAKEKIHNEDWKHFGHDQLIQGVFIGVGYTVLVINYPYASPNVILEFATTVIVALCGCSVAIWIKRRILASRPSTINNAETPETKPKHEKHQTPKTKNKVSRDSK